MVYFYPQQLTNLISPGVEESDKFQLTFCQLSNSKFDIEEIMKLPFCRYFII